jgi:hypothetical protein
MVTRQCPWFASQHNQIHSSSIELGYLEFGLVFDGLSNDNKII